jgi:hypothetical protein
MKVEMVCYPAVSHSPFTSYNLLILFVDTQIRDLAVQDLSHPFARRIRRDSGRCSGGPGWGRQQVASGGSTKFRRLCVHAGACWAPSGSVRVAPPLTH